MITHRTYTFAKRYIQKLDMNYSENSVDIDGTIFDHKYDDRTLMDMNVENFKYEKYGMHKRNIAQYNGFKYMCIYPWDDYAKILNCVLPPLVRIYARQCKIYKLYAEIGRQFIDQYDIYGNCRGQTLFLGLLYENQLVQVMSFGKSRNKDYPIQLMRMCTKSRYQVIGGFSRLFKFALNAFDIYNIISYNDLSKFSGDVFSKLGMRFHHINPPQLLWFKDNEYIADSVKYLYHKTKEDMIAESYLPIYNCGTSVYVYE